MVQCGEADVVFLHDGWVERVEVQQENESVVETTLWFQNQPSRVCWLPPPLAPCQLLPFIIVVLDGMCVCVCVCWGRGGEKELCECDGELYVY